MQEILYKFQDQEQVQIQHKGIMGIILHQYHYNKIITGNNINQGSVQQQPGNTQNNGNNTTIPQRQQPNTNSGGSVITR